MGVELDEEDDLPWDEEHRLAHATGKLLWGMWICDCAACREVCLKFPDVLVVIKGSAVRKVVTAGQIAHASAEELIEDGYVREVYVCKDQSWPYVDRRTRVRRK